MNVEVSYGVPREGVPAPRDFRNWIAHVGALLEESGRVSLRLVDETEGGRLNRDFRGRAGATNVLSFPAGQGIPGERFFGDIVLCAPRVAAEARAWDRPVRAHYAHLTIHGFLHLLGYEHERAPARRRMDSIEIRLLSELGLPDPYETSARSAS